MIARQAFIISFSDVDRTGISVQEERFAAAAAEEGAKVRKISQPTSAAQEISVDARGRLNATNISGSSSGSWEFKSLSQFRLGEECHKAYEGHQNSI